MTLDEIKSKIIPVLRKYEVTKAGIFGSYARGEASEDSDVDILVDLPKNKSLFDLVGLKQDLEEILSTKVDVVTYKSLYHLLREPIFAEEITIAKV
jgi:uncharacterized protein